jgi:SAM-dependent methyltransferase
LLRRLRFDLWYLFHPPWDSGVSPPELHDFMDTHPPGRAIDLGCGTGTNVLALAKRGWHVTGIDFSPRAIRIAKRKLRAAGMAATLQVEDVALMRQVAGPYDLALDIGCFHGLTDKQIYVRQLVNILAPEGKWLMYGIFKAPPYGPGPGLIQADLDLIRSQGFHLLTRWDGVDRGSRPSGWFLFARASAVEE